MWTWGQEFSSIFFKSYSGTLDELQHTGRVFSQTPGKLTGVVPSINEAGQDIAVGIGQGFEGSIVLFGKVDAFRRFFRYQPCALHFVAFSS